jgi:Na+/citrate or Na+/malate symporter
MYVGKTLFAQVMEFVPWTSFARIVHRHGGNSGVRTLSCAEQFRAMAFAQLTWRESLRETSSCVAWATRHAP